MDNQRVNKVYQDGKIKWKQRKNTKRQVGLVLSLTTIKEKSKATHQVVI